MHWGPMLGLAGDALTVCGGLLLAWDTVQKDREVRQVKNTARAIESPLLKGLPIEIDGVLVVCESDVERAFIRRSARKAAWGCVLLAAGFILLFATRLIEMVGA